MFNDQLTVIAFLMIIVHCSLYIVLIVLSFSLHKFAGFSAFCRFLVSEQNNQINESQNAQYIPNGVICRYIFHKLKLPF
tara:strand:- start:1984 stop:2220 length:237 start_codon:yes stop_codon:yes gene_type:complete